MGLKKQQGRSAVGRHLLLLFLPPSSLCSAVLVETFFYVRTDVPGRFPSCTFGLHFSLLWSTFNLLDHPFALTVQRLDLHPYFSFLFPLPFFSYPQTHWDLGFLLEHPWLSQPHLLYSLPILRRWTLWSPFNEFRSFFLVKGPWARTPRFTMA